jgi:1,4-dihydroxy-2-naphthoyl-CoA hydrolase
MIWKQTFNLEGLNQSSHNTLAEHLGITYTEIGDDFIVATMPVDHRTVQPMRLLHGGASAALAETLGSVAGLMCIEDVMTQTIVGTEISCSHLRSAKKGLVTGKVSPLKIGRRLQVWNIDVTDEQGRLICVSRLTIMVVDQEYSKK